MRKIKTLLVFLITLGLLGAGAYLPQLVAAVKDRKNLNQPGSQNMASVALDLSGERKGLSTAGKIDLLRRGKTIAVTEREASMMEADVNAAVEILMDDYIAAGIFNWFEYTSWVAQPYLCVDLEAPDNFCVFWSVTIINENKPYQTLEVDIDDETGKIFSIRYDRFGEFPLNGVWERNMATADAFVHVYLNQLELLEENVEPHMEYHELDGHVLCGGFSFEDEEYGGLRIEFYTSGNGAFWLYFPE